MAIRNTTFAVVTACVLGFAGRAGAQVVTYSSYYAPPAVYGAPVTYSSYYAPPVVYTPPVAYSAYYAPRAAGTWEGYPVGYPYATGYYTTYYPSTYYVGRRGWRW